MPKHHHDHGNDASVPAKGNKRAVPADHWEMTYHAQETREHRPEARFDPICAKDRPKLYTKVNETDH